MAQRTWNISITPPAGVDPEYIEASVHFVNRPPLDFSVLDESYLDSQGAATLSFDDSNTLAGEYSLIYLIVYNGPWAIWVFGPYDVDGNPKLQ